MATGIRNLKQNISKGIILYVDALMMPLLVSNFVLCCPTGCVEWDLGLSCVNCHNEKRRSRVVRAICLWCRNIEVASLRLGAIRRLETSVSPALNGYLYESGKDNAAKGGCASPFICCVQDTVGL